MKPGITYTNLNDKWSTVAAKVNEPTEKKPAPPPAPIDGGARLRRAEITPTRAASLALSAEEKRALAAKGLLSAPGLARPVEKNGTPLATEGAQRSQWMDVTPEMAKRWLANNFRNRPLAEDTVIAYSRDMLAGAWVPTHQGIAFNDRDELIDGQHRLHAIIRAGVTVRMMVTFGLASKIEGSQMTTMDAVDRGRTRSVADQLKIQHGLKDGSQIAAITSCIGSICYGERTKRLSVGQTLEIYEAFRQPIDFVIANRSKEFGLRSAGVLAAFAFVIAVEPRASEWFMRLNTGKGLEASASGAVQKLREFLTSEDAQLLGRSMNRGIFEVVAGALLHELNGSVCHKLEVKPDGAEHFIKLQPARVEKIAAIFRLLK